MSSLSSFSRGRGKPLQGVINCSKAESRLARFQIYCADAFWIPDKNFLRLVELFVRGAPPSGASRMPFAHNTPFMLARQPPDQRRDFIPGFANYD